MTTQQTPMHFPIDECAKCTVRGDMGGCLATRCSLHESWYARTQHARITELESQLAQRFDAADMATAAAQGFRDGVASVSAVSETVASYAIRLLVAAALITKAKADEALRLAAELSAAPGPADGESNG